MASLGETGTTRVYHGTSAEAAEGIVTAGFGMSYDYSSAGVFVKKDKSAVHYAMEHASTPKGAVVEAVLFLKGGSFTHRGDDHSPRPQPPRSSQGPLPGVSRYERRRNACTADDTAG